MARNFWLAPVRVVTGGNIALTGLQTIDSVAMGAGQSVLVAGQTDPTENGIYLVAETSWARRADSPAYAMVPGVMVCAIGGGDQGTVYFVKEDLSWELAHEAVADVTGAYNVGQALADDASAKDMGGGAVTNVGNVDGRDVSADGIVLDAVVAENTDGEKWLDILAGVADAGTWTAAVTAAMVKTVTRTPAAATEYYFIPAMLSDRNNASRGRKATGVRLQYTVATADATDIRCELFSRIFANNTIAMQAAVSMGGSADGHYDADHNTAAKRGLDTANPQNHTLVMTLPSPTYTGGLREYTVRVMITDPGTSALIITGCSLLYSELLVDDS